MQSIQIFWKSYYHKMNQPLSKWCPSPALIKQYRSGIIYLMPAFTRTKQTDRLWSGRDRRKDTEATHQPHVLHSAVLLVDTKKKMDEMFLCWHWQYKNFFFDQTHLVIKKKRLRKSDTEKTLRKTHLEVHTYLVFVLQQALLRNSTSEPRHGVHCRTLCRILRRKEIVWISWTVFQHCPFHRILLFKMFPAFVLLFC